MGRVHFRKLEAIVNYFRGLCVVGALFLVAAAQASPVTFSNRENVNLLNSDAVTFTVAPVAGSGPSNTLIGDHWMTNEKFIKSPNNGSNISIAMDFGAGNVRNVKTIRNWDSYGGYNITNALIETSTDGSSWSALPAPTVLNSGDNVTISLASAVTPVTCASPARPIRPTTRDWATRTGGQWARSAPMALQAHSTRALISI
jgi:hypothetical protein